ncbi:MAG: hypothetical protein M1464_00750, partial [Candidatus Thermoplasmatota archaeon]|nr:hypothetical protein [Candidatus Thermoplasmatota archaeon]
AYDRQVSMVFSADMAHTHASDGPYGYSPAAKIYDDSVQDMFRENNFSRSIEIPESVVIEGKPDSFWNLLIMLGFLQAGGIRMHMEYYYVEHYFGMLFAHS